MYRPFHSQKLTWLELVRRDFVLTEADLEEMLGVDDEDDDTASTRGKIRRGCVVKYR